MEIKDILKRQWRVVLQHTLMEANFCADFLAKKGAMSNVNLMECFASSSSWPFPSIASGLHGSQFP